MTETTFGPIVSTWDVEQACVATLREWMNEYLRDIELKNNYAQKLLPRPPAFESYHGGVDEESWTQDRLPEVIVAVEPEGAPQLRGEGGYNQEYNVTVGCIWVGTGSKLAEQPQDEARAVAAYLGAASMLLLDHPTLGGLSERVRLKTATKVSAPNPDRKDVALATTVFSVWVPTIFEEGRGPLEVGKPYEEPYPAEPTVKETKQTVTAKTVEEEV